MIPDSNPAIPSVAIKRPDPGSFSAVAPSGGAFDIIVFVKVKTKYFVFFEKYLKNYELDSFF